MNNINPQTVQGTLALQTAGGLVLSTNVTRRQPNNNTDDSDESEINQLLKKLGINRGTNKYPSDDEEAHKNRSDISSLTDSDDEHGNLEGQNILDELDIRRQGGESWVTPNNGPKKVGPRRTKAQLRHSRLQQICIWSHKNVSVKTWWNEVQHIMGTLHQSQMDCVHKIIRVRQKEDNLYRYDLFTTPNRAGEFLSVLLERASGTGVDWKIRNHISWNQRQLIRDTNGRRDAPHQDQEHSIGDKINIAAWNIQWANKANKRQALDDFLTEKHMDIMFLSETRLAHTQHIPLQFTGYQVFETRQSIDTNGKIDQKACSGLAFIVRESIFVRQVEEGSNYNIVLKVNFNQQEQWTLIGHYIPPGNDPRTKEAKEELALLTDKYQEAKLLHMGDLNHKVTEEPQTNTLLKWMLKEPRLDRIARVPQEQEGKATHKGSTRTKPYKIDHFLVSKGQRPQVANVKVHDNDPRWTSASDHHPISLCLQLNGHVPTNVVVQETYRPMMTRKVLNKVDMMAKDNRFAVLFQQFQEQDDEQALLHEMDDEDTGITTDKQTKQQHIDEKALRLVQTIHQVAEENEVLVPIKKRRQRRFLMSKKGKQLAKRAHRAFKICNAASPRNQEHDQLYYTKCKNELTIETNRCRRAAKRKQIRRLCGAMGIRDTEQLDQPDPDNEPKILWNTLFNIMGKQGASTRIAPQRDNNAEGSPLVYDDDQKLKLMAGYFRKLLLDPNVKTVDEWKQQFLSQGAQQAEQLPKNDDRPTWNEVHAYIKAMPRWKVGGTDCVKAAFFKGVLEESGEMGNTPNTPLGKVLYYILCDMFDSGLIPQIWQEGKTILIFKGGKNDPSQAEAYRGITVMASVLKMLVATVLDRRFKKGLEHFFRIEQAGFRGAEECSGHVVAFYEVVMARKAQGLMTFATLIDIKNAYDTVPINAFIAKLELAGVNGKTLQLIQELYRTAQQKLHTHLGLSEFIRQLRGLRQGDPSSPIIFNVFINDIFDRIEQVVEEAGVSVVGLRDRLLGLLFADDLVIWAETPEKLQQMMDQLTEWANVNHMTFGIGKCGVMGFGTGATRKIKDTHFLLQTKRVPVVSSYKYLGVIITTEMDMGQMVQQRINLGLSRLNSIRPTLRAQWLPIYFRVKIIKTMLIPVLTWGAELWGVHPTLSERLQAILDKAINTLYGFKDDNTAWINKRQAMVELEIPPIYAIAAAAVARGRAKFHFSKTVVSLLMKRQSPHSSTWTAQADLQLETAVKKHNRAQMTQATKVKVPVSDTQGRNMYQFALQLYWQLYNKTKGGIMYQRYEDYHMSNTNHIVRNMIQSCPDSMDFRWLLAARGSLLHTVNQLTRFHIIHENIDVVTNRNGMCPWCSANIREDPAHVVLQCQRFQKFRGPLQPVLEDMVWELATLLNTAGPTAVLKDQTPFENQHQYPRPDTTNELLFHVVIGGTWKDKKMFDIQHKGKVIKVFWIMRCKNFLSKTTGVPSHYITVQTILANIYQHRNFLLDKHFTAQDTSMRTCWLFNFPHSEPTPFGRARTTDVGDESSSDGASVIGLDPE